MRGSSRIRGFLELEIHIGIHEEILYRVQDWGNKYYVICDAQARALFGKYPREHCSLRT